MVRSDVPRRGDVYWIDPNPVAGREMKDRCRFVVITPRQINALGASMTVPITTGGSFARGAGLAVVVIGHETTGVAVCNQVRSFDTTPRVRVGAARFIETLDKAKMDEIVSRAVSAIDPGPRRQFVTGPIVSVPNIWRLRNASSGRGAMPRAAASNS